MQFLTDRKRAQGTGAGGHGTHHHWQMMISSICLVPLVPLLVIVFGSALGRSQADAIAYLGKPFPAIVMGLSLIVIIPHLMREVLAAVEDYVHGTAGKLAQIGVTALSYTLIVAGLYALVKIAL